MSDIFSPPPPPPVTAHRPPACRGRGQQHDCPNEHRCYLYRGHYGPCKAKRCGHEFQGVSRGTA